MEEDRGSRWPRLKLWARRLFVLFLLAGIVVGVFWMRETGILELNRYTYTQRQLVNIQLEFKDQPPPENFQGGGYTVTVEGADAGTAAGVQEALGSLTGALPGDYTGEVALTFAMLEFTGGYWKPYDKKGAVEFEVRFGGEMRTKRKTMKLGGAMNGTIKFEAEGFCSVYALKRRVGKELGQRINEELSGRLLRN